MLPQHVEIDNNLGELVNLSATARNPLAGTTGIKVDTDTGLVVDAGAFRVEHAGELTLAIAVEARFCWSSGKQVEDQNCSETQRECNNSRSADS